MHTPSLLQKFGRDLLYLCIIGCLVGWIWMDRVHDAAWNQLISNDLKWGNTLITACIENDKINDIIQIATEYKSWKNDYGVSQSKKALNLTRDSYKIKIQEFKSVVIPFRADPLELATRPLSKQELITLKSAAIELADSLTVLAENDLETTKLIQNFLLGEHDQYWQKLETVGIQETPALLQGLFLRADMALTAVLNYWRGKVHPGIICNFGLIPVISPEKHIIKPGEYYRTEIFPALYSTKTYNLKIKVDGKPIPSKDGLAYFSKQYTSAGEKSFKVEMEYANALTGEINTSTKDFGLLVVDTCR